MPDSPNTQIQLTSFQFERPDGIGLTRAKETVSVQPSEDESVFATISLERVLTSPGITEPKISAESRPISKSEYRRLEIARKLHDHQGKLRLLARVASWLMEEEIMYRKFSDTRTEHGGSAAKLRKETYRRWS